MKRENRVVQLSGWGLSLVMVLVMMVTSIAGQDAGRKKFLKKPLVIEDQGSFFIGGVPKVTNYATLPAPNAPNPAPNQITIGQMYVQFQIPANKKANMPPVIMVHGSTHTAACLESTPDGREGWAPYFVRKGISTYIVDQAGRGRSGFDESVIHEAAAMIRSGDVQNGTAQIPSFGRITDNGAWTAWFGHLMPAGSTILTGTLMRHGDPGDPPTDDAATKTTTSRPTRLAPWMPASSRAPGPSPRRPQDPNNYYALEYYKQLVPNAEVTLPGSTCATCDPTEISPANTWTPQDLALLVEKLGGAVVATHSQSGIMGHHMVRILKERGHLDMLKGLITIEGRLLSAEQRAQGGGLRQYPLHGAEGRLRRDERSCADTTVDAINARRAAGQGIGEGRVHQAGRTGQPDLQRHDAHDDARARTTSKSRTSS